MDSTSVTFGEKCSDYAASDGMNPIANLTALPCLFWLLLFISYLSRSVIWVIMVVGRPLFTTYSYIPEKPSTRLFKLIIYIASHCTRQPR
jgi:hypothetical protein